MRRIFRHVRLRILMVTRVQTHRGITSVVLISIVIRRRLLRVVV